MSDAIALEALGRQMVVVPVPRVQEGDITTFGGIMAQVQYSEPQTDHLWSLTFRVTHADGDSFYGEVYLPVSRSITVWRA